MMRKTCFKSLCFSHKDLKNTRELDQEKQIGCCPWKTLKELYMDVTMKTVYNLDITESVK